MNRITTIIATTLAITLCAITLSACGPIEGKVRNGLMNAGVHKTVATCMAGKMVDKLSVFQLNRMASLGKLQNGAATTMSRDELLHHVRALKDPEILTVTSAAWLKCAI
jgi:hypothetical protein